MCLLRSALPFNGSLFVAPSPRKRAPLFSFNAPYEVFSLVVDVAVDDEVFAAAAVEDDDDAVAEGAALVPEGVEAAAAAALSVVFELLC